MASLKCALFCNWIIDYFWRKNFQWYHVSISIKLSRQKRKNYYVRSKTKSVLRKSTNLSKKSFKIWLLGQSIYQCIWGALQQNSIQIGKETLNQPVGNKRERIFKRIFWSSKRGKNSLKLTKFSCRSIYMILKY